MFSSLLELLAPLCLVLVTLTLVLLVFSDVDIQLMLVERYGKTPESLARQVVWITGANGGIGEFLAYRLAKAGCRLVLSSSKQDALERVKAACLVASEGRISEDDILLVALEFPQFSSHGEAVQKVISYFSHIDILVNNAGTPQFATWMNVGVQIDMHLFKKNVLGPVSLTQNVLPHMIEKRKGHIVVLGSVCGKISLPLSRSYNGSKFAIQGYFDSLRAEIQEHNIDVSIICTGPYVLLYSQLNHPRQWIQSSKHRIPTDRCADAIATAIANKLYEVWIAQHPWLLFLYMFQYTPDLGKWFFLHIGAEELTKLREG